MKKKTEIKKLALNKETVTVLNNFQKMKIVGGGTPDNTDETTATVVGGTRKTSNGTTITD